MKLEQPRDLSLPAGVLGLAATADAQRLYAACMDGQIFEVDVASGALTAFSSSHASFASGSALLPDGKTLITSGFDGVLIWHDTASRSEIRRVKAHDFWSWKLALSPDGSRVASVTGQYLAGGEKYEPAPASEPTVKVFDAQSGSLLQSWELLAPVLSVAISADGKLVAAANLMGDMQIWDVASGKSVAQFNSPDFTCWGIIKSPHYCGGIYALAFAPDGASLLCAGMGEMKDPMSGNGKMTWQRWVWGEKPKMLEQIHDGEHGAGLMEALMHTPDGASFLMAGRQAQGTWNAAVFSVADGKLQASLDTKSRVTQGLFSGDGKTLFLAAAAGQGKRDSAGKWPDYGRIHVVVVTA